MTRSVTKQRLTAFFFLLVLSVETLFPVRVYALTSGPSTPEMAAFEPASTSNMVDLFSGDFSYNIPLLDVGGYPVNLSYHSGGGPEEEASWVGFGWTLNPGAINRQLRGLPDDFDGDEVVQEDNRKPNITVGGNINTSIKLFGFRLPKIKIGRKKKNLGGDMKVKIGILHNNYTGYKGTIGIGTGFGTSDDNSDAMTKGLGPSSTSTDLSAGLGISVDNQAGVNPYSNFEINYKIRSKKEIEAEKDLFKAQQVHGTLSLINSIFYGGLFDLKESKSKVAAMNNILRKESHTGASIGTSSSINFNGYQPPSTVQTPIVSTNVTASLALGVTLFNGTVAPGIEGTFSKQELKDHSNTAPAYGFMNSHHARAKEEALMDYNMEKESPYFKRLPNLGVTVFTPDLFSVTSNAGSMQFRPYLKGAGIFFQPHKHDADRSADIGLEPAFGNAFHIGVPLQLNKTNTLSGKWVSKNDFVEKGDFKSTATNQPENRAFYFKRIGEKSMQDKQYFAKLGGTLPVAVRLDKTFNASLFGNGRATKVLRKKDSPDLDGDTYARVLPDKVNHEITTLSAEEASQYALEKLIPDYRENTLITATNAVENWISRVGQYRKAHHISQYTITQDDGQRMVYGTPVYNTRQEEVSFAISHNASQLQKGVAVYKPGIDNSYLNTNGKDHYYHKSMLPSYTTGHLLTAILSPDYVDMKDDGITDDDLGTAVRFDYSLITKADGEAKLYKWRTPYSNENNNNNTANYNKGYRSVTDDDKGNYSWGEKEQWYLHSIVSKTMVAQFYTEDRNDGVGVIDENGGKNANSKMKLLREIRLFSKADLYTNGDKATPIKVVHFEYYNDDATSSDVILNLVPNNLTGKGKLTLKRIWFSYGNNSKGQYHAYVFKYKIPADNNYQDNQSDRWGNYKPKVANPNGLDNLDFPYAIQNKSYADDFASFWQLDEILLPSGAVINIDYESDDYAFVQDRKATQMCFMSGIGSDGANSNFATSDKIYVKLPVKTTTTELGKRYFEGLKSLAYKAYVDLDGAGKNYEYVGGYAEILGYQLVHVDPADGKSDVAEITVGKINGYHPVAKAAWQKLKLELPRFAYPEYDNIDAERSGFVSAIKALGASFSRFKDLVESFDSRAKRKGFASRIDLSKSWVRLCTPSGINSDNLTTHIKGKLGGGHRVRNIRINDQWRQMSGVARAEDGSYGQHYEYTETVVGSTGQPEVISSGVASYEPAIGGDENPFHEPVNYIDKHFFGQPKFFYMERPMGESYFPGASVGYSKVTVANLGADGSVGANGSTVCTFYTAKDFPTKVEELPMERNQPKLNFLPRLFGAKITSGVTVSQGYVIENNDMHGRPKEEAVYGKNGNEVSLVQYHYKVQQAAAEKYDLLNTADVALKDGTIVPNATVGMDIDMFTEMNESEMENMGVAVDPAFGIAFAGFIPTFTIRLPLPKPNYEKRLYRGSSTVKLVNRFGLLDHIVKRVNGSESTTQNLLWDAETGEVLLTKTDNEFGDPLYTFSYPAHWVYDGMGSAFKNEGVYLQDFRTDTYGKILSTYNDLLVSGDELIDLTSTNRYWVIDVNTVAGNAPLLELVNQDGGIIPNLKSLLKIIRSGRRNLASASIGTIVSMVNPISGNMLDFSVAKKILQAKALDYEQYWPIPVRSSASGTSYQMENCTDYRGVSCACNCLRPLFDYLMATEQLFIQPSQNITVAQLVAQANAAGYSVGSCPLISENNSKLFYALTSNATDIIYKAQFGNCKVSIRSTNSSPVSFYGLYSYPCNSDPVVGYTNQAVNIIDTFPTSCTQNIQFSDIYHNSDKIVAASSWSSYDQVHSLKTYFTIPGTSTIPTTAVINWAQFYLYAYPQGFDPPFYSNAHTTSAENQGNNLFSFKIIDDGWNCQWPDQPNRRLMDNPVVVPMITSHFQDIVLDWKKMMKYASWPNLGFGFVAQDKDSTNQIAYATFASENYLETPSKRPKLVVNYSVPVPDQTVATLQVDECTSTGCTNTVVNPYQSGLLGNWRVKKELVYDTKRVANKLNVAVAGAGATHLRNSGYFELFEPYWKRANQGWIPDKTNTKWQWTSEVMKVDRKGQEIESQDALKRFSAAQYGYLESVPVAVATNARYREIGFDGFEDYTFNLGQSTMPINDCDIQDHFSFRQSLGAAASLDNVNVHSGKFSLKLNGSVVMAKPLLNEEPGGIYSIIDNQYTITNNYLRHGFQPLPGKTYVLSGWVYDGKPKLAAIEGLTLKICGFTYPVNSNAIAPKVFSKVHVVEGWKRFEVVCTLPSSGEFQLEFNGSNINIDDIRIHPYDAQLKSFVYDAISMRLMAELDENNFATFYEYDDEGTLIRVKKETEKGISTIKETRSSIRKQL